MARRQAMETAFAPAATHSSWGHLATAEQLLITLRPNATAADMEAVLQAAEAAGGQVVSHLPDHTLLVLGGELAAAAARASGHVIWVGNMLPEHKLAPEWQPLLTALAAANERNSTALSACTSSAELADALTAHAASPTDAALLHGVAFDHATHDGWRAPVLVSFPPPRLSRQASATAAAVPGEAAAADWAAELQRLFGNDTAVQQQGSRKVLVRVPLPQLPAALAWLSARPAVHWLSPYMVLRMASYEANAIIQGGVPADGATANAAIEGVAADIYPAWAAGLRGEGEVVGIADSGLAWDSCYFLDANNDITNTSYWRLFPEGASPSSGIPIFDGSQHRKIRQYVALADTYDGNGHGTHCAGLLAGMPAAGYTESGGASDAGPMGVAPLAKLSFLDIGADAEGVLLTGSLSEYHYPFAYSVGARVHSDSWGSTDTSYDAAASEVDEYTWMHPDFLPVLASGNDGDMYTPQSVSGSGEYTVTSPATAKNCISVGATLGTRRVSRGAERYVVHDAMFEAGGMAMSSRVVAASFGLSGNALHEQRLRVAVASPLDACEPLADGDYGGAVVLAQRGTCTFAAKALAVQEAGGVGVLIYDDEPLGSYFTFGANVEEGAQVSIFVGMVARSEGVELVAAARGGGGAEGSGVVMELREATGPEFEFDNLATFSSQGPTRDGRIKPDLLAPGFTTSAGIPTSMGSCATSYMEGTSMATPLVAGAAVLAREYFTSGRYPSGAPDPSAAHAPSGALLKAVLLGGAASITGFEFDTGLPVDPAPSYRQGYGRLLLAQSLGLETRREAGWNLQVVDGATLTPQRMQDTYCVRALGGPLVVTLVWWDYPASPASEFALVNDLDLSIRLEGGQLLRGNIGSLDDESALPDNVNTVERISIEDAPRGLVAIEVRASRLFPVVDGQAYALVVHGSFNGTLRSDFNPAHANAGDDDGGEYESCEGVASFGGGLTEMLLAP